MRKIDINLDAGESFGAYQLGSDEVMKYPTSVNLACGFHAGDPVVMAHTVKLAKECNVAVGAHPGLPDLRGFGRREIKMTPEELKADLIYQIGALDAFLRVNGLQMQHVKPHGILYRMVSINEEYAEALVEAISDYNPGLYILTEKKEGNLVWEKGKGAGLRMVAEVLVDLNYDAQGNWVIEREKKPWDPQRVADRAIAVVKEGKIDTVEGKLISIEADTICCHGDAPNAIDVLKKIREEFDKQGITVAKLGDFLV